MALSIDDLRSFILVATERSVTRAAAHLDVSQQSVSERIRRLEHRVGVKLFNRLAYGMQPTAAGFRLLPYASQCVSLIDQALAVVDDDDLVRLQVQSSAGPAVMPYLERLVESSSVEVSLVDDVAGIVAALTNGSLDVGIGVFPAGMISAARGSDSDALDGEEPGGAELLEDLRDGEPTNGDAPEGEGSPEHRGPLAPPITVEALFTDPIVWAAPPDHPLALERRTLTLADLSSVPGGLFPSEGGSPSGSFEGVRAAARSALATEISAGRLVELPVDNPGWVVPISIAYRLSEHDRPAIVALRNAITEGYSLAVAANGHGPSHSEDGP